jgi:hypothetical protein
MFTTQSTSSVQARKSSKRKEDRNRNNFIMKKSFANNVGNTIIYETDNNDTSSFLMAFILLKMMAQTISEMIKNVFAFNFCCSRIVSRGKLSS